MLADKSGEKLRVNPRKSWYNNLSEVTTNGDYEVVFHLRRRQPSFIALLASGWSPVYPCHVSLRDMRSHPIGTGPFKFVEFKPNEVIRVARNPHYWKNDRPYLDAMEHVVIPSVSTRILGFITGKFDLITLQPPLLKDVKSQAPQAICDLEPDNAARNLIVNRTAPPFDNSDLRWALTLSLDRKAFIEIITEGQGYVGGAMLPPPEGVWGMSPEMLSTLPGYGPDVQQNREKARETMQRLGYGHDKRLAISLSTRNRPVDRDPAVVLLSQLKEVYIDAELQLAETPQWYPKVMRKDYAVALSINENSVDDPDQTFYENYVCDAAHNYTGYCNQELDKLIDEQSTEPDAKKRKQLAWNIERKLAEDDVQPIIFYGRFAMCWQPRVKGLTVMVSGRSRLAAGTAHVCGPRSSCITNRRFVEFTTYALASRLTASWIEARVTKLARVSARFSKSLERRRFRPNQEKVRSTTQRRGRTTKPLMSSLRLTISMRSPGTFLTAASTCHAL